MLLWSAQERSLWTTVRSEYLPDVKSLATPATNDGSIADTDQPDWQVDTGFALSVLPGKRFLG